MTTATAKKRIARTKRVSVVDAVREYLLNRSMRERSAYHEGVIKADLMTVLEQSGEHEGNSWKIALDEPLDFVEYKGGKPKTKSVVGIERRERSANTLNEEKAMALLKKKKLVEQCTETITVLSEDAILAANYEGRITDKELAAIYETSSTFAFHLTEG